MALGQTSPTSPVAEFTQMIVDLRNRIADLERIQQRLIGVPAGSVTNVELADMAAARIKGRASGAGSGDPTDLTAAQVKTILDLAGSNTGDQTITLTGTVTGSGPGSFATTIAADAVANTMLANMAAATLKGRASGAGTGDPTDLTAAQARTILALVPGTNLPVYTTGSGAPAGTGTLGDWYLDTTAKRLYFSDGGGWIVMHEPVQTNTTASFAGFTGGTPTYANQSRRQGGMCWFKNQLFFGGTPSAWAGPFTTSLPYQADDLDTGQLSVGFRIVGLLSPGISGDFSTPGTSVTIYAANTAGTYLGQTNTALAIPFTWQSGTSASVSGWFRLNNPYA